MVPTDKYDGRLGLPGHLKHLLDELLGLTLPLGNQVRRRHCKEGRVGFRGYSLREEGFTSTRRSI